MKRFALLFSILLFVVCFITKAQDIYYIDPVKKDQARWHSAQHTDSVCWDFNLPNVFGISTTHLPPLVHEPDYLNIVYTKTPGKYNNPFELEFYNAPAFVRKEIVSITAEKDAVMSLSMKSSLAGSKVQLQISTGSEKEHWSLWTEVYTLRDADVWYNLIIDWDLYKKANPDMHYDFTHLRRMNIRIIPEDDHSQGTLSLKNLCSISSSKPVSDDLNAKLSQLQQHFGTQTIDKVSFLNDVLEKTVNFFTDPQIINLTHGFPRTGYVPGDLSDKGWSNPTEWGYYLNALSVAYEYELISAEYFNTHAGISLNTLLEMQNSDTTFIHGQYYSYYNVKDENGNDIYPDRTSNFLPSIDNAFLTGSLFLLRNFIESQTDLNDGLVKITDQIINNFDYRIYWDNDKKLFSNGYNVDKETLEPYCWDIYGDESPYLTEIAYMLGDISETEYKANFDAMMKLSDKYTDKDGYTLAVENANWDGSLFTYLAPAIHMHQSTVDGFYEKTIVPAVTAQMLWARDNDLQIFGWSDLMASNTCENGAPPTLRLTQTEWEAKGYDQYIAPYALFLPLNMKIYGSDNTLMDNIIDICLYEAYQLHKSKVWSNNHDPGIDMGFYMRSTLDAEPEGHFFGTLDQFYILGSVYNYLQNLKGENDFRDYFVYDTKIRGKHLTER